MKCERKNSPQGLDIHKMVHIAMEKCFVGEMVYLAFRLANTGKNSSNCKLMCYQLLKQQTSAGTAKYLNYWPMEYVEFRMKRNIDP